MIPAHSPLRKRAAKLAACLLVAGAGGTVAAASAGPAAAASPCGAAGMLSSSGGTATCTYTAVGEDTFTIPAGVASVSVTAVGAPGGAGSEPYGFTRGGAGASAIAPAVPVAPGGTLYVEVGGAGGTGTNTSSTSSCAGGAGGINGGAGGGPGRCYTGGGGGGGGASDVRTTPASAGNLTGEANDPRLVVAGGGGGGGGAGSGTGGAGGSSGGSAQAGAGDGGNINDPQCEGVPGPAGGLGTVGPGGGAGGTAGGQQFPCFGGINGGDGTPGAGGGGGDGFVANSPGGGGGGGGYIGGGGGATQDIDPGGGGGGGSSFGPAGSTYSTASASATAEVAISWLLPVVTTLTAAPATFGLLSITFSATLTGSASAPVPDQTVVFSVRGQTVCQGTTSSEGVASCTVVGLEIGPASYTASFAGNASYLPSSAQGEL